MEIRKSGVLGDYLRMKESKEERGPLMGFIYGALAPANSNNEVKTNTNGYSIQVKSS